VTPVGWLAGAVLVITVPARAPARVGALIGVGRLVRAGRGAGVGRRAGSAPQRSGDVLAALRWQWLVVAAAATLVGAVVAVGGVLLAVAAVAVAGAGGTTLRDLLTGRATAAQRAQLLAAVRVLSAELEAGARPSAALSAAAAVGPRHADVFDSAAAAAGAGGDAGAVLGADPATRLIGLAWQLGEQTGVALAGVLDRVAADLAAAEEQRRTVAVALAGPRSSAALLAGLPLLGIGLGVAMDAHPLAFLTGSSAGRAVGCVGVLLDVAGVFWMRRILRRAQRP
jgi:tight adherence protein B